MNFEDNGWLHPVRRFDPVAASAFSVLVAYEDFATGNHALRMFERLFPEGGGLSRFTTRNVWKFDLLEIAKFREMAAEEAAGADMVILSLHGKDGLPRAVKRWMDMWVLKRVHDTGALVVLLDSTKRERGIPGIQMETYLQTCAFRAGMDFFLEGAVEPISARRITDDGANPPAPSFRKILPLFARGNSCN
jgi:hypothetical protein